MSFCLWFVFYRCLLPALYSVSRGKNGQQHLITESSFCHPLVPLLCTRSLTWFGITFFIGHSWKGRKRGNLPGKCAHVCLSIVFRKRDTFLSAVKSTARPYSFICGSCFRFNSRTRCTANSEFSRKFTRQHVLWNWDVVNIFPDALTVFGRRWWPCNRKLIIFFCFLCYGW